LQDSSPPPFADDVICDDRFSFNTEVSTQASFVYENVKYTLEIVGFMESDSTVAVKYFSTLETNASRADVYARLVTVCDSTVRLPS
jgi:hypothetical protein